MIVAGYARTVVIVLPAVALARTHADLIHIPVRVHIVAEAQPGAAHDGRIGRLIMFKECLRSAVVPFIITYELKLFYYRGLREWGHTDGFLTDTCLTAQDQYKAVLDYFRIKY